MMIKYEEPRGVYTYTGWIHIRKILSDTILGRTLNMYLAIILFLV